MDLFSGYVYCGLWFIIAIYMTYLAFKHSKFFLVLSVYFLFMSAWYLINQLTPNLNMFVGVYEWIFKGVALCVLIVCVIAYVVYKKSRKNTLD